MPEMTEKTYIVKGLIKSQDTLVGIPDLLVVALDIDFQSFSQSLSQRNVDLDIDHLLGYDRLGSVLTDQDGRFELEFEEADFKVINNEPRPDIMLIVSAPEVTKKNPFDGQYLNALSLGETIIHVSPPIRLKAGRHEAYSIRITREIMEKYQLNQVQRREMVDPESLKAALEEQAENSQQILKVKLDNFNTLIAANEELKSEANKLFASFSISTVSDEIKGKDTFLTPDDSLPQLQESIIAHGLDVEGVASAAIGRKGYAEVNSGKLWQVSLNEKGVRDLNLLDEANNLRENIPTNNLWDWWGSANDTILERRKSAYESCLKPFREQDLVEPSAPDRGPTNGTTGNGTHPSPSPDLSINEIVQKQLTCITCPEEPLVYSKVIDSNYKSHDIRNTINDLVLVSGPTDVTSFHDFHSIQIAFETIWTELFDTSLEKLGKSIFSEIVRTYDPHFNDFLIRESELSIEGPSSLRSLLQEYRSIRGQSSKESNRRLDYLFDELEQRLNEPYKFDVFAADSFNFGMILTFRQKWEPGPYQVGRLVNTIPLAPKEERKYTTKTTKKLTKAQKEIEEREFKGSSESSNTSRAESEVINRATNKTSFSTNSQGTMNLQMAQMQFGMNTGMESEKFSSSTKKNFRESVLKAAQEYRKQTKLEVNTTTDEAFESTSYGFITNPNDEIAVTYLFYELQRQYEISEQLHRVTPIITVAFEVPQPHEIDNDWLMTYHWIIRRVLLDESYHLALDYITQESVGSEIALQALGNALKKQEKLVDELNKQLELRNKHVEDLMTKIVGVMTGDAVVETVKEVGDFVHGILNPFAGLMGGGDSGPDLEKFKEILELQLERAEKEQQRLAGQLKEAQSDLQAISQKFGEASQDYFNQQTAIAQLRIHVKENILYYMQAIWDYEPIDQRYFRLYDLEIDWFYPPSGSIPTGGLITGVDPVTGELKVEGSVELPLSAIRREKRKLVDVADIDNLLGFKGNYAIFPAKEMNYIHLHMMQDYIDTQTGGVKDPDAFADVSTQELIDYLKCIRTNYPDLYISEKDNIIKLINERQQSPRKEKELVIVPTDSLYLECLPGKHPILEDFKLVHRAIDVKKVQAEVRNMELENMRYAARLRAGERHDPEIDKQIIVRGDVEGVDIDV